PRSEQENMMAMNRRSVIKAGLAGVAAAGARIVPRAQTQTARLNGPLFYDVETANGVVRGMANTGIKIFRGIPYGADTGGRNRFMPPKKAPPRAGVRNSIGYGPISPQTGSGFRSDYSQMIQWDKHIGTGGMSEDCL